MYIKTKTWLDIVYAILKVSLFVVNLRASHSKVVKSIFWYINGKQDLNLVFYNNKTHQLVKYVDVN